MPGENCHAGSGCIDAEGHCTNCGTKRKLAPRDHFHQAISATVAGVSDIGMKYKENQDYMALGEKSGSLALVVCDGMSNSQNPMRARKPPPNWRETCSSPESRAAMSTSSSRR